MRKKSTGSKDLFFFFPKWEKKAFLQIASALKVTIAFRIKTIRV